MAAKHIGLYGNVGNWTWTDGTPVNYTNWQAGEPVGGGVECTEFHDEYVDNADEWYTVGCHLTGATLLPLCQRDIVS
ncbi:hypothetical protein AAVH_19220 [Aphelenchoides avenae]|nr:hypothetical protein AAVH_19220 [Aphelenchus avenae]